MKQHFKGIEIDVAYNRFALAGRGGVSVSVSIPDFSDFRLTIPLEDAETLGEALIACVRSAEARATR